MNSQYLVPAPYKDEASFQLLVKASDLTNGLPVELDFDANGEFDIYINTIQISFSTDPTYMRLEIQSPQLQFDYGNVRYIQVSYPFASHNLASGQLNYKFRSQLNSKILINIIDTSTKAEPTNFSEMIIGGTICKVN